MHHFLTHSDESYIETSIGAHVLPSEVGENVWVPKCTLTLPTSESGQPTDNQEILGSALQSLHGRKRSLVTRKR